MPDSMIQKLFAERIGGKKFGKDTTVYKFEKIKRAKRAAMAANPEVELIDLGVGEPDGMAPEPIVEALAEEARKPENRGYTDNGIAEFRQTAAGYMADVFGVKGLDPQTRINHSIGSKSALALLPSALVNPGDVVLMTVPGYPVFGTHSSWYGAEVVNLAESADLVTWAKLPVSEAIYGTDRYTACPSMRWLDGHFYMFYLERMGGLWRFDSYLTRSPDLLHWEGSPANPILAPEPDEDINNSDIDFTEFEGRVVIYYSWGSQRGEEHLAHATFDGTLSDWLRECYP